MYIYNFLLTTTIESQNLVIESVCIITAGGNSYKNSRDDKQYEYVIILAQFIKSNLRIMEKRTVNTCKLVFAFFENRARFFSICMNV